MESDDLPHDRTEEVKETDEVDHGEEEDDDEIEEAEAEISDPDASNRMYRHRGYINRGGDSGQTRLPVTASSSSDDDDSEKMFGRRGINGDSDEDDEEDEQELSTEFWSSDDSSLLHSQDELASPNHSSNEEAEMESLSDHRLRRVPRMNYSGFDAGMTRPPNMRVKSDNSPDPQSRSNTIDILKAGDTCSGKELSGALDPITEEESATEDRRSAPTVEPGKRLTSMESSSDSADEFIPSRITKTGVSVRYSMRNAQHSLVSEPQEESPLAATPPDDAIPSANHTPDVLARTKSISRLYLLPVVKLVVEWVCCFTAKHPELLFSPPTAGEASTGPNTTERNHVYQPPHKSTRTIADIAQEWCAQLAHLLNELYPTVEQIESEFNRSEEGTSEPESVITKLLSPFGRYALLHELGDLARTKSLYRCHTETDHELATDKPLTNENVPSSSEGLRYALPEDWLLRGLDLLSSTVLRSIRLMSLGHKLMKYSDQLGAVFTVDLARSKPFIVPELSSRSHDFHPLHRPPSGSHPSRHGRGRFPHRYQHSSHFYYQQQQQQGCGEWTVRSSRWSAKRGHWFGRAARGHGPRGHPTYLMRRSGKSARSTESYTDPRNTAYLKHPQCGLKLGSTATRGEANLNTSPTRTGSGDVAKQSSNSSLSLTVAETIPANEESMNDPESRKTQVMRDMARLRLLNEVDQLTRQFQNVSPRAQPPDGNGSADHPKAASGDNADAASTRTDNFVSPYLVLDAYCLTGHLPAVKQLVQSGAFVLIIPTAGGLFHVLSLLMCGFLPQLF
ncbi:unnamed protein product [Echinostoma caproni]|uniref:TPR_REGION domain-containing protein n=1 Tax=Echinostoma caproni TaxID=27848 RepID=A0A183ATB8_9TREM|nr:unnamed protein product [Echinostoma caproni]